MPGDTHTCGSCGEPDHGNNRNGIGTCGRDNLECNNPCGHGPGNTPRCESLPSQIQNFTDQFFGTVVKTVVNGEVAWSLPCGLDVGLPENPRGVDEGLACYFLRLFQNGISGLRGLSGQKGADGANGVNAYAVIKQGFSQPTLNNPLVQFVIFANPSVQPGLTYFIVGSGSYLVTDVQSGGVVFATFLGPAQTPVAYIASGTLVLPSGQVGAQGVTGAQGATGATGAVGATGPAWFHQQGFVCGVTGNGVCTLGTSATAISFAGGANLQFVVPATGVYLITGVFSVSAVAPLSGVPYSPVIYALLRDVTASTNVPGSLTHIEPRWQVAGEFFVHQITVNIVCSASAGHTAGLFGYYLSSPGGAFTVVPEGASLSWVQVA